MEKGHVLPRLKVIHQQNKKREKNISLDSDHLQVSVANLDGNGNTLYNCLTAL